MMVMAVFSFLYLPLLKVQAVTISPVRLEITGDPGTTVHSEFTLVNDQPEAKIFYTNFENFEAQGETGAPNFTPGKDGLATWMSAPSAITLEPQEKKVVPFSITIPVGAEPGGNFAAIFLGTSPPDTSGGVKVSIGGRIGLLILLKVSGPVKEGGGLLEFFATNKKKIFTSLPINLSYRFSNTGSDRVKPAGEIVVKNTFGLTSVKLDANPSEGNILPGSIRKFEIPWGTPLRDSDKRGFFTMAGRQLTNFHFGYYTAKLQLVYGTDSVQNITGTTHFWIIPWQLLLILLIIIGAVVWFFTVGIKKYNHWIIRRARLTRKR